MDSRTDVTPHLAPQTKQIKVKARLIVRRGQELLLEQRHDESGRPFYRPLGGNIEFAEPSSGAVMREFSEETHRHVENLKYLGCLEDIRETADGLHHEVIFIYEGTVVEPDIYELDAIVVEEDVRRYTAYWKPIRDFEGEAADELRPANLLTLLRDGPC